MSRGGSTPTTPSMFCVNTILMKNHLGQRQGVKTIFGEICHFHEPDFLAQSFRPYGAYEKVFNVLMTWNVAQSEAIKMKKKIFGFLKIFVYILPIL